MTSWKAPTQFPVIGVVWPHSAAQLEEYCHNIPCLFITQKDKGGGLLNFSVFKLTMRK